MQPTNCQLSVRTYHLICQKLIRVYFRRQEFPLFEALYCFPIYD